MALALAFAFAMMFALAFACGIGKAAAEGDKMMRQVRMPAKWVEHRHASTERTWIGGTDESWVALRLLGPISDHDELEHLRKGA